MWLPGEGLVVVVKPGEGSVSFSFSQLILEVRAASVLADVYISTVAFKEASEQFA